MVDCACCATANKADESVMSGTCAKAKKLLLIIMLLLPILLLYITGVEDLPILLEQPASYPWDNSIAINPTAYCT